MSSDERPLLLAQFPAVFQNRDGLRYECPEKGMVTLCLVGGRLILNIFGTKNRERIILRQGAIKKIMRCRDYVNPLISDSSGKLGYEEYEDNIELAKKLISERKKRKNNSY